MYVNPIPFGIFIGVVSTIVVEIFAILIIAFNKGGKNE